MEQDEEQVTTEEEKGVVSISDVSLAPIGPAILYVYFLKIATLTSLVVQWPMTPCFHCKELGFNLTRGTPDPYAAWHEQK